MVRHILFSVGVLLLPAKVLLGADTEPVQKSLHTLEDRYSLVGVIAEGSAKSKGIAVVKDRDSGKTYTLRVGDVVPDSPGLKLERVSRSLAIISGQGQSLNVVTGTSSYYESHDVLSGRSPESLHGRPDGITVIETSTGEIVTKKNVEPAVQDSEISLFDRWYMERGLPAANNSADGVKRSRSRGVHRQADNSDPIELLDERHMVNPSDELLEIDDEGYEIVPEWGVESTQ
jgi:hypothetical protein